MALNGNTFNCLESALGNRAAADEIRDILEATQVLSSAEAGYLDGVTAGTATASKALVLDGSKGISTITSATITTLTTSGVVRTGYTKQIGTRAKVGGTSGWTVGAANDLPYVGTVAASQTGATLVIPIDGLHIGDTITGFRIVAQVESAGGTVTIDAALRATTNVAADPTDALIGSGMTQVSVTADTAVSQEKTGLTEVVASGKTYYLLVTVTTGASTDVILQACEITVTTA